MRALLAALCLALLVLPALAAPEFADLDAKTQRNLAESARAYFDPEVEFLLRPRKDFVAALEALEADPGANALADIPLLRAIVYQGRHFLPRFSDKTWQRDAEITDFEKTDGLYLNLKSERNRFTYTLPGSYPQDRAFDKIPRPDPYPVLLSIHEEIDGKDARQRPEKYPGGAVLKRRYPKDEFEALYDDWLVIAPVAARAKFLEDGAIRHRFLTAVLTSFWRRYHVDFGRIVVDGAAPAAAMAAAFPHVFAGLVLRPGKDMSFEPEVVRNYATVPVFVVDDKDLGQQLAEQLEDAGHPDVTIGSDEEVVAWMNQRRRVIPKSFHWTMLRPDHGYASWVTITGPDYAAPERVLDVQVIDTESDPNTIRIDARGIQQVMLFLNDEIVDLDREVRLVVNGEEKKYAKIERDFDRLFELDPKVRENMNFGWLYPVLLEDVAVSGSGSDRVPARPQPAAPRGTDEDERKAVLADPHSSLVMRLAAQQEWFQGRPDLIERHLGEAARATGAVELLPFALRDLWWRPANDPALRARCEDAARETRNDVVGDQLRWILGGGGADPYPRHGSPVWDPWPVLTALVIERRQRETTGARWLPDESPVLRLQVPEAPAEWQDDYAHWIGWVYEGLMRTAYEGEDPERLPEEFQQSDREQARLADQTRSRNLWLALIVGAVFVGGVLLTGRRFARA